MQVKIPGLVVRFGNSHTYSSSGQFQGLALRPTITHARDEGIEIGAVEERLNADLKYAIGSKIPARTKDKLKAAANAHMQALEQAPERVKKYFQDPFVKYAAGKS